MIKLAKSAGFCFGVSRAVDRVFELANSGEKVTTLGPIIHNKHVVADLQAAGVGVCDSVQNAPEDGILVIRSHGVAKSVYDEIEKRGLRFEDATCPFVAKIHKLAAAVPQDQVLIVAGDPNHPEVQGIVGHSNAPFYIVSDLKGLQELAETGDLPNKKCQIVSQTTFHLATFLQMSDWAQENLPQIIVHNTVCHATENRQKEAAQLSKECDLMVVVGDSGSSNTAKLKKVCEKNCETLMIETANELLQLKDLGGKMLGITAGASTPSCIIKEVLQTMSELQATAQTEEFDFAAAIEESLKPIRTGQRITGIVTGISASGEVSVDIGAKFTGFIPESELSADGKSADEVVKKGDEIGVVVVRVNDAEGTALLSKKRYDEKEGFEKIVKAEQEESVLTGVVTDVIKGGVLVTVFGTKVFVPASLATLRKNDDLAELKGKEVEFKVIEVDDRRARAIGSVRAVAREKAKALSEAFWASAEVDKVYAGTVKSLTNYGAFVDLGGVDGMVHISELSWKRVKHPSEVLAVGDTVEVFIKALDAENKKISLGYKKKEDNPWYIFETNYKVGSTAKVTIVSTTDFGAFARIIDGVDGLIHISQISNERVEKVSDVLKVGDVVEAKITEYDAAKKRVSLSMRALLEPQVEEEPEVEVDEVVYSTDDAE